ncbi:astacin [Ancylostoma caninum]|uniref:Metalloendopeptidase n=1 Tax=Ancylostoma caninum TaxID=29170 RepID=A0A368GDX5_ANCCA|nr:astacin [Ancylostoma caninum]
MNMRKKIKKTLELGAQVKASLEERLKLLLSLFCTKVPEGGTDFRRQFEEIEEDVQEELSEGNRTKRQAFKDGRYPKTIWSDGVNYYFDNSATQDKIRVFAEDGCWSFVGRLGGEQDLSLGSGCESVGTAAHELGHAFGFYHTMSRHDRDSFITLNTHNIKPDWLDQFTKQTPQTNENYGITYDYGSIMHYGGTR